MNSEEPVNLMLAAEAILHWVQLWILIPGFTFAFANLIFTLTGVV